MRRVKVVLQREASTVEHDVNLVAEAVVITCGVQGVLTSDCD